MITCVARKPCFLTTSVFKRQFAKPKRPNRRFDSIGRCPSVDKGPKCHVTADAACAVKVSNFQGMFTFWRKRLRCLGSHASGFAIKMALQLYRKPIKCRITLREFPYHWVSRKPINSATSTWFDQYPLKFARESRVMKVVSSIGTLKNRHPDCQVVKRRGRIYVICKSNPKFKVRQGGAKVKKTRR